MPQRLLVRIVADFKTLTYQITRMLNIDNILNKPLNSDIIFYKLLGLVR